MSADRDRLAAALHALWAPGDPSNIDVAVAALDAADALLPVVQALVAEGAAAELRAAADAALSGLAQAAYLRASVADWLRDRADALTAGSEAGT